MLRKALLFLFLITLFISPVLAVNLSPARGTAAPPPADEAARAVLTAFHLYSSFLGETCLANGKAIPVHGPTPAQAINYLQSGFSQQLAVAIIDETTCWDKEQGTLVVVPKEGIPVLTEADLPLLVPTVCSEHQVLIERRYQDCFAPGDSYLYIVEVIKTDCGWRVNHLSWQEENRSERVPWPIMPPTFSRNTTR